MLASRLVQLIEAHSDRLATGLIQKYYAFEKCTDLRKVPEHELQARAYEIYRNLSEWLLSKTEAEVERRYVALGARRAAQGVRFSHFLWAVVQTKEHLHEFMQMEGFISNTAEALGQMELLNLMDRFFDRALYYAAIGYEEARKAKAA